MNKILLFWLFLIGVTCQAQLKNISIQLSGNYPLIGSVEQTDQVTNGMPHVATGFIASLINVGTIKESFSGKIGFTISGQVDYPISNHFFITSGLSIGYLRFQRTVKIINLTQVPNAFAGPAVIPGTAFGSIIFGTPVHRDIDGRLILNPDGSVPISRSENVGSTAAKSVQIPCAVGTSLFNHKAHCLPHGNSPRI